MVNRYVCTVVVHSKIDRCDFVLACEWEYGLKYSTISFSDPNLPSRARSFPSELMVTKFLAGIRPSVVIVRKRSKSKIRLYLCMAFGDGDVDR